MTPWRAFHIVWDVPVGGVSLPLVSGVVSQDCSRMRLREISPGALDTLPEPNLSAVGLTYADPERRRRVVWEDYCSAALWGRRPYPFECWRPPGHDGLHYDIAACAKWSDAERDAVPAVMNPPPGRLSGGRAGGRMVAVSGSGRVSNFNGDTDGD